MDDSLAVQRLVARAAEQVELVLDQHVARIREAEPEYRSVPVAELRADARALLMAALSSVSDGTEPDTSLVRRTAQRRAAQGLSLGPVLHAFRLGSTAIWESLLAVAESGGGGGSQQAFLAAAQRLWAVADAYSVETTQAYQEGLVELAGRDARRRLEALTALLDGRPADWARLSGSAALVGLAGASSFVALVSEVLDEAPAGSGPADDPGEALRHVGLPNALLRRSGRRWEGVVALPGPSSLPLLMSTLRTAWPSRTGVSEPFDDLTDTAAALDDARAAERCLPRTSAGAVRFGEDRLALLLTAQPDVARAAAAAFLAGLLGDPEQEQLLRTLAVHFETGSVLRTAEHLYCHRNTVSRRLRRVEQLTGRRLDSARGSAELYLAVQVHQLL